MKDDILKTIDIAGRDYIIVPKSILFRLLGTPEEHTDFAKLDISNSKLHAQVRELRKLHKISQQKLAQKSELKQPDVSDFELSGEGFSIERKKRIVHALQQLIEEKKHS